MPRGFFPTFAAVAAGVATTLLAHSPAGVDAQTAAPQIATALLRELTWRPIGPVPAGVWPRGNETPSSGTFTSVRTDTAFPYRVCGGQADAGAICVASRSGGAGPVREWETIGLDGIAAPDPGDADLLYGGFHRSLDSGAGHARVGRFDRRTGQTQDVSPPGGAGFRAGPVAIVQFSPTDPRTLYFAANTVWRTVNGGLNWTEISPDLSRASADAAATQRGVISALAPSPVDSRAIWVGTSDGQIHITRDTGTTWRDVTPAAIAAPVAISRIVASHFDASTGYAVVNAARAGDGRPQIYRTRDGGGTWVRIIGGIGADESTFTLAEDVARRGLLFAGTDRSVYVSFDDGDRWQPLQLNMPATSIRDVAIKDADLIVATDGRGFWILDDISPLRQITADVSRADAFLFRPATVWRSQRVGVWRAQPAAPAPTLPPPPDGVALAYLIGPTAAGDVTLEIIETATGEVIRRFSNAGTPNDSPGSSGSGDMPRADLPLDTTPGLHRVLWDLRHPPPPMPTPTAGVPDGTTAGRAPAARGVFVLPGTYQVRLTVGTRAFRQAVVVRMDPRVRTSVADLTVQFKLSRALDDALRLVAATRADLERRQAGSTGDVAARLRSSTTALESVWRDLASSFEALQHADTRPTAAIETAAIDAIARAATAVAATRDGG